MKCDKCKCEVSENAKYCSECGWEIKSAISNDLESREVVCGKPVVISFIVWLLVYALVAGKYAYGPFVVTFTAQLLTMAVIYVGIFTIACVGGLLYKVVGRKLPMKRIVNATLISSIAVGGLMIFGLQYSAK